MLRREFLHSLIVAGAATLIGSRIGSAADEAPAMDVLAPSFDFHSHGWRQNGFAAGMKQGGMNVAVMASISDRPLIKLEGGRLRASGSPPRGHLHYHAMRQVGDIKRAIESEQLATVLTPAEATSARAAGRPGIIIGFEGADVLEGSLERVGEIHAEGARLLQLVHYRVNELGDIQTEEPVHNGLTPFGADVVRACNRLGIIVDVAHATFEVTAQVLKTATRPLVLSHTYLIDRPRRNTRGITRDHARAVAETGGAIGIVPFPSTFPTLQHYANGIAKMADAVGVDHVGIASDMTGIPVGTPPFNNYQQLPQIVQALADTGFKREEVQKIMGGNFMRVFKAVSTVTPN